MVTSYVIIKTIYNVNMAILNSILRMRIIVLNGIVFDWYKNSPLSFIDQMIYLCMDCRENSETW